MFCPPEYVSVAGLWKEFIDKHYVRLSAIARQKYCVQADILPDEFGSPLDFSEDVFLSLINDMDVFAAADDGRLTRLETVLDGGRSRLFSKLSVFESALVASDPQEAGPDNYWLYKMGSRSFEAWTDLECGSTTWRQRYPFGVGQASELAVFHTLPITFERTRFIIPDQPPPWSGDVIDEHFLPRVIQAFAGCALCLSAEQAKRWRGRHIVKSRFLTSLELSPAAATQVGRPGKQSQALHHYLQLHPSGQHSTLTKACREIKQQFGLIVATKTLGRAIKAADMEKTKPRK